MSRPRQQRSFRLDPDFVHKSQVPAASDGEVSTGIERLRQECRSRLIGGVGRRELPGVDELRRAIVNMPFRSFRIWTNGGRELHVRRPDLVALSVDGSLLAVFDDDGPHIVRTFRVTAMAPLGQLSS
jgi:hypothetical protein